MRRIYSPEQIKKLIIEVLIEEGLIEPEDEDTEENDGE